MLKITITELTDQGSAIIATNQVSSAFQETVVYTQTFKELNVSQLVTSINKTPRARRTTKPVKP